jgi:hypothetical protein
VIVLIFSPFYCFSCDYEDGGQLETRGRRKSKERKRTAILLASQEGGTIGPTPVAGVIRANPK